MLLYHSIYLNLRLHWRPLVPCAGTAASLCCAVEANTDDTDSTDFHGLFICANPCYPSNPCSIAFSALSEVPKLIVLNL
jgi:hypothetical protein